MRKDVDLMNPEGTAGGEDNKLVFPLNVYDSVTSRGSMSKGERNGIIFSLWVFASLVAGWFLAGFLRNIFPTAYLGVTILIELVVQFFVGSVVLRMMVDEESLKSEVGDEDRSFARYFDIYHERIAAEGASFPYDSIEFNDGSQAVYIRFLLGYNTNQRSQATYEVNKEVTRILNKSGMAYRVFYTTENFANSKSADLMISSLNKIKDSNLFRVFRDITRGLLKTATEESNVMCTTYVIYAKTRIQKDDFLQVIENILRVARRSETVYRLVSVLSYDEIVEFYRSYYKLGVIDMGKVRAHNAVKNAVNCPVKVVKIFGASGKSFTTAEYNKMIEQLLREQGIASSGDRKV